MDIQSILNLGPYSLTQKDKDEVLLPAFNDLVRHHVRSCPEYARIINLLYHGKTKYDSIDALPYLPVNIFKEIRLSSVPDQQIFKTLLSSGTTGTTPSQIILDIPTSHRQTIALAAIMETYLGGSRLPMLIIDSPNVVKDPKRFNARGAGIVGMAHFGRDHLYALNDRMELDHNILDQWLKDHPQGPFLIFGFTYILWKHLYKATKPKEFDLSRALLFHSGGWKKLEEASVDNRTFKVLLHTHFGLNRCYSFYSMAEQVGNIFLECEEGNLHCPSFADIVVRDPITWQPCPLGQSGVVQVLSVLPTSYPGHSLLTEDLGQIKGIDSCPCGRKGKFFWIEGRIPQAEPRGCGDIYALERS